jgi:shikimate dehydrogenase
MKISGRTKITGIIGYPIEHTLSPAMHNAAFASLGLDYCYVPFLVYPDNLATAVKAIRALNMRGVNVTVPHKERVIPFLDGTDGEAAFIGAVNTIVHSEGTLTGYNTDGRGFMQSLFESGISPDGKEILIIGAGGAARAVGYYLSQKAGALSIFGRTREKAERLAHDLNRVRDVLSALQNVADIRRFQIIINATPLGLKKGDPLPFDTALLQPGQTVCDLIYRDTPLLDEAAKKGCRILNGSGMLLWQGALAFELWTGRRPDIAVMRDALMAAGR